VVRTDLAVNLRRVRQQRGLSTVALARHAEISRATLAQLEAGSGNPTLETLYALANALGATLADLISEPSGDRGPHVVRHGEGSVVVGAAVEARLLRTIADSRGSTEIYDFRLHGGVAQTSAPHVPGTREHLYLSSGRIRVGPSTDPVELNAGDFVSYDADEEHLYQRLGRGDTRGVLVITRAA
jgi:transcriptional regulator with XRE-family HTH domain